MDMCCKGGIVINNMLRDQAGYFVCINNRMMMLTG